MIDHNPHESRAKEDERGDAEFIGRIAGPLRAPESLDASFEERLMAAVNADVRARGAHVNAVNASRSWWRRGRTVTLSPLAMLAAAASVVAIFAAGAGASFFAHRREPAVLSRADTVRFVRFVFVDSAARSVAVVGDFNGWTKGATQLLPTGNKGTWVVSVP